MATEEQLRKIEKALRQPVSWKMTGSFGSMIYTLPRLNGTSPLKVVGGKKEEMLNSLGFETAFASAAGVVFTEKFLGTLTEMGAFFVLLHELGHLALRHGARRKGREPRLWNVCGDIRINQVLMEQVLPALYKKTVLPEMLFETHRPIGIGMTPATGSWFERYRENSEEEIYYIREKEVREQRRKEATPGNGGSGKNSGGGKGKSTPGGSGGGGGNTGWDDAFADHIIDPLNLRQRLEEEFGDDGLDLADELGLANSEGVKDAMDEALGRATQQARQMSALANRGGNGIGSHVDAFVDESIALDAEAKAKLSWVYAVQGMVEEAMQGRFYENPEVPDQLSEWSRVPELREQMGTGEIFRPALERRTKTANVVIIMDTSGSVSTDEIKMFLTEIREMAQRQPMRLTLVSADTTVRLREVFEPEDLEYFPDTIDIGGRGGTDMSTPLIQEILAADKPLDLAIIFSDGEYHPITYTDLYKSVKEKDDEKSEMIPPLALIASRPHFANPEMKAAAATFDMGMCELFILSADSPEASVEIAVSSEGLAVN